MMPSWVRISILAAAVLLAAYSALYARQITEGPRDEGAQAARELYGQGALAAARMAALLGPVDAGLTAGAAGGVIAGSTVSRGTTSKLTVSGS